MNFTTIALSAQDFQQHIKTNKVTYSYVQTPAGLLCLANTEMGVFEVAFVSSGPNGSNVTGVPATALIVQGTKFQVQVWQATLKISAGKTMTYQELACALGRPKAYRAVANALGKNKLAYLIPCHRVIRKNGDLGGFAWGIEVKKALLEFEQKQN